MRIICISVCVFLYLIVINWKFPYQFGRAKIITVDKSKKPRPVGKQPPRGVPWKLLFMNFRNKKNCYKFCKILEKGIDRKKAYSFNNKIQQFYTIIMSQHHSISWYQTKIFSAFTCKAINMYNVIDRELKLCIYIKPFLWFFVITEHSFKFSVDKYNVNSSLSI